MPNLLKSPIVTEFTLGLIKEADGGYSAIALNLPGTGSCGETEAEAIDNAREAIRAVMEVYREQGEEIPWRQPAGIDTSEFVKLERVTVDV
jgi:predicted RNase H-like HicB family nuclease